MRFTKYKRCSWIWFCSLLLWSVTRWQDMKTLFLRTRNLSDAANLINFSLQLWIIWSTLDSFQNFGSMIVDNSTVSGLVKPLVCVIKSWTIWLFLCLMASVASPTAARHERSGRCLRRWQVEFNIRSVKVISWAFSSLAIVLVNGSEASYCGMVTITGLECGSWRGYYYFWGGGVETRTEELLHGDEHSTGAVLEWGGDKLYPP